jgi:hypothetical protein
MAKLTFYPLGNADCCLIDLANGKKVLFDFGNQGDPSDKDDKRCDLATLLRENMQAAKKDTYDILAITHLDDDHTHGAEDFFYLEHNKKYQGKGRYKFTTMWVPAGLITEDTGELDTSAEIIQTEAQWRLRNKKGIRVFSRPEALADWLKAEGIKLQDVKHLITDAGNLAPELSLKADQVEFFVHSPFAWRQDESTVVDRNRNSLVMQATFEEGSKITRAILGSDICYEAIADIVKTTKRKKREERLESDIIKLPHHCSYTTIGPEKGRSKTKPTDDTKWLFETQSHSGCIIVSPSQPIPSETTDQPPHRQAAAYYREDVVEPKNGEFLVTMESPSISDPQPIEIDIGSRGATALKRNARAAAVITSSYAPRAGRP